MEYRILGQIEVYEDDTPLPIGGPRHRKLLAILLVHADDVVPADRLIEDLWGEDAPQTAPAILHVRISELRQALKQGQGDAVGILTRGSGYELVLGPNDLDARTFELLVGAGHTALAQGDQRAAGMRLEEALAVWRGPALAEVADEHFAQSEVARLEALHLQAIEDRLDVDLMLGRHAEAAVVLKALVAEHPLRERFWSQLMLAQYRSARQADALQSFQRAREVLIDELGIEPGPELQQLHSAILNQDSSLDLAASPVPPARVRDARHNLPRRLTSFIGREEEREHIADLLTRHRLVSVVGTGGIGKSRIALEVARERSSEYAGGTWLVELAPVSDPDLLVGAIAAAVGVREQSETDLLDLLCDALSTAPTLLLLDNCEQLVESAALVAERLLESCPDLTILTTSRERLGLSGEALVPLAGLAQNSVAEGELSEATRLFLDRAGAANPDLALDPDTVGVVAEICSRLDGVPLAIELASARVNALAPVEILGRLDDRFRLLDFGQRTADARHRTLSAVVEWSYSLLTEGEARVFDTLSCFVGGFTLEAAERVCSDDGMGEDVASILWRLVDKSLVISDTVAGTRRYRLLETLREYGVERRQERNQLDEARERHAAYFLAFAEPAGLALRGVDQPLWLDRLELEHDNLRAALAWTSEQGQAEIATRLAGSLYPMWDLHGHYREGLAWLRKVLDLPGEVSAVVRARALLGVATLATIQADLEVGQAACEEAAALSAEAGDPAGLAHALQYLGLGAVLAAEFEIAEDLLDQSLDQARAAGDAWLEGWAWIFYGALALSREDHSIAVAHGAEADRAARLSGDPECVAWAHLIDATGRILRGEQDQALPGLREGLISFRQLGGLWGLSVALFMVALRASLAGAWERALPLFGASERVRVSVGATLMTFMDTRLEEIRARASAELGADFDAQWRAGEAVTVEAAVGLALTEVDTPR